MLSVPCNTPAPVAIDISSALPLACRPHTRPVTARMTLSDDVRTRPRDVARCGIPSLHIAHREAERHGRAAVAGRNAFEGYVPSVPSGEKLDYGSDRSNELEERGAGSHCVAFRTLPFGQPSACWRTLMHTGCRLCTKSIRGAEASMLEGNVVISRFCRRLGSIMLGSGHRHGETRPVTIAPGSMP